MTPRTVARYPGWTGDEGGTLVHTPTVSATPRPAESERRATGMMSLLLAIPQTPDAQNHHPGWLRHADFNGFPEPGGGYFVQGELPYVY